MGDVGVERLDRVVGCAVVRGEVGGRAFCEGGLDGGVATGEEILTSGFYSDELLVSIPDF